MPAKQVTTLLLLLAYAQVALAQQADSTAPAPVNPAAAFAAPDSVSTADTTTILYSVAPAEDTLVRQNRFRKINAIAVPAAAAGLLAASYFWVDHDLQNDVPNDQSEFKETVSRWAEPFGRGITIQPGFGALMVYGLVAKDKRAKKAAVIGITTYFINVEATANLKKAFGRMRPSSGAGYNNWFKGSEHRSFPSSHTSTAFAAATVVATVYNSNKLVPPIAYTLAAVVGFSRLYHNQHWASDVVAGAITGYASAKATTAVYNWAEKKWRKKKGLTVIPQFSPNGGSLTAIINL